MTESKELKLARDETLRKIGRNVLYLQKMESMLKILGSQTRIEGNLSEFKELRQKAAKAVSHQTMGTLVSSFVSAVYSNPEETDDAPEDGIEPYVSFSFSIESDDDLREERQTALDAVVADRNHLIHVMIGELDVDSISSCEELEVKLDEQKERFLPELQILASLVRTFNELVIEQSDNLKNASKNLNG